MSATFSPPRTLAAAMLWLAMQAPGIASADEADDAPADTSATAPPAAPAAGSAPAPAAAPAAGTDLSVAADAAGTPDVPATAHHSHRTTAPSLSLEALGVPAPDGSRPGAIDYDTVTKNQGASSYLWPLVDVASINLTLWSIPYALGVPFAQVNPTYWRDNLATGLQWDDNEFGVNQLAHPWQGGMYFTTARVNGLTFWEAVPYTLFGSLTWEYFLETEQPSTNDWLSTTWGGFLFGESLYRLSNYILDDSTSGSTRFWKEFAALATNPVNGADRLITGQAWADGPPNDRPPLTVNIRAGADGIGLSEGTGWGKTFRAWIRFDYGDPYAEPYIKKPFDYFNLAAQLSASSEIFGQGVDSTGVLFGHRFGTGATSANLIAWTLNFEYFTNGTTKMLTRDSEGVYQLAELGTGASWLGHFDLGAGFWIDSELDALAVPMGGITSPYAKYEANRNYNYGLGGTLKLEVNLRHERFGRLYAEADRYLFSIVDGSRGVEHVGTLKLGAFIDIYAGHGIGAAAIRYDRNSYYDDYPNVIDSFWSGQLHYEVEF
jgi:uncharacterized protein DUF3943